MITATAKTRAEYIRERRQRKAAAIVALVERFGITYEMLRRATTDQWITIALCADVAPPSTATRKLVYRAMRNK